MIFKAIINWFFMDVSIQFPLYLIYSNLLAKKIIRTKKLIFIAPFEKGLKMFCTCRSSNRPIGL